MNETPTIQYLNTDLDLICDVDPAVLATEFESRDLVAHVTPGDDGLFYVLCEDSNDSEPEPNIVRLLDAIEALSVSARELWDRCSKREFNVGYDCGDEPLVIQSRNLKSCLAPYGGVRRFVPDYAIPVQVCLTRHCS